METLLAPAKLNLFLRIVRRREDGYHDIETLFQRISLADRLSFDKIDEPGIHLELLSSPESRNLTIAPQENLIAKAYRLLQDHLGKTLPGVQVFLEKQIPLGGGLGGGSSDAATTLLALNSLLELHLRNEVLSDLAFRLGSDVPFFLGAPTAIGRSRGEQLTSVQSSAFWHVALAFPDIQVSTAEVYRRYKPGGASEPDGNLPALIESLQLGNLQIVLPHLYNEMESLAFEVEPALGYIRMKLENAAGQPVRMSGSGSTLFTLTDSAEKAAWFAAKWQESGLVRGTTARFYSE